MQHNFSIILYSLTYNLCCSKCVCVRIYIYYIYLLYCYESQVYIFVLLLLYSNLYWCMRDGLMCSN